MPSQPTDEPQLTSDSLVGKLLGGRYRITEALGRGGAGHVFGGIQDPLGREVAVKVLRTDIAKEARAEFESRFLREAALAGKLHHPNIVTVHDYGVDERGLRYVVMERLRGRTLRVAMRGGPMAPDEVARIAAGVARGLRHAHEAGLVHRDIKPSNIFLVPDDDGVEVPMLLDFGLVKDQADDSALTQVGTYMGTPAYMAPEQALGTPDVDHRSDIYALGCVMYAMLSGVLPFASETPLGLAVQHQNDPLPTIQVRSGVRVPAELENIVRRCMEKKRQARFSNAGELARALDLWGAGETIELPLPRRGGLGWWVWLLGAGALGMLVVVALSLTAGAGVVAGLLARGPAVSEVAHGERALPAHEGVGVADTDTIDSDVAQAANTDVLRGAPTQDAPLEGPPSQAGSTKTEHAPSSHNAPDPAGSSKTKSGASSKTKPASTRGAGGSSSNTSRPSGKRVDGGAKPHTVAKVGSGVAVTVDGVYFEAGVAARALVFVNTASEAELRKAGMVGRSVGVVLAKRPFGSMNAFGATPFIGPKTVEAVARAVK